MTTRRHLRSLQVKGIFSPDEIAYCKRVQLPLRQAVHQSVRQLKLETLDRERKIKKLVSMLKGNKNG
ncbi:MAG: hypothetical protein J4215_01060 [Candidatus Diapherotrites archaeon]|uniref:Uncharacterized protein n=1 Tax=Candidatus Iainarchaeum sp. TaxID=3101447 RepID=A0A8T4L1L0_9ARCH|nr:hypothetical protein [Candidatus Diapherotrites archaeon]